VAEATADQIAVVRFADFLGCDKSKTPPVPTFVLHPINGQVLSVRHAASVIYGCEIASLG
jgi:hypothetical protein